MDFLDMSFHDCKIIEINKNDNNLILIIEDGYWPYDKIYNLSFINVSVDNIDKIELNQDIISNSVDYKNNKYHYYIGFSDYEIYEFICDDIKLETIKK